MCSDSVRRGPVIRPSDFDGAIFDLDGVVTDTASVHARAWKEMFDRFLALRAPRTGDPFRPFEMAEYRIYIDGKPRFDGIRSFLASRGILLPEGTPEDPPEAVTVHGLGRLKNDLFLRLLREQGVTVYRSTVQFVHLLKRLGMKTSIISSSRNCEIILEKVQLLDLFDVRVDGVESARLGIAGKPAPDIFLEAARRLGVAPSRALVVEDAVSGVEAGRAGGFGFVIGVDRGGNREALRYHGADLVVGDLAEVAVEEGAAALRPSALASLDEIRERCRGRRLAIFLDYDGTLVPIAETPDRALMSDETRSVVTDLARRCTVAVISGRDLPDVRRLVALDSIFYAGSHGFDMGGPEGLHLENRVGVDFLPDLEEAGRKLTADLARIPGILIERKKFAVAVHYRRVAAEQAVQVERAVDALVALNPRLRKTGGKKIFELRPAVDWHKGKALLALLRALHLDRPDVIPLYIGDDVTDEDAFGELEGRGIGIAVQDAPAETSASYRLKDTGEVRKFLESLAGFCAGGL
ncbi:trehalose-phosphatase [Geobacter sp. DSM 9736]|uniref:trehalose-phosphatase n=1 Tax=Geobacter sp. DSM 9736 TaxID=1277350 RepID=UPI000B4FE2E6|nr:trehalose-phosphatase [Geobacter sp. DSM 9736]SNB46881.1 trehalose 6-phosphatase [Geobacter sp. DSM 9736]